MAEELVDTTGLELKGARRPGYFEFMKSQFRFNPLWVPAVLVTGYIQWRNGGWLQAALALFIAFPLVLFAATWWEWRKMMPPAE